MPFGMGLNKNRHGTYEARKKVPRHLEEAVARVLGNGKPKQVWLKRSLATKDFAEAKRRVKAVQIEFDRILERAQELLAERPLRDTLSDAEIKLIADWHYAEMLHIDDEETREGTGRDEAMRAIAKQLDEAGIEYDVPIPPSDHNPDYGLSDSEFRKRVADLEFMMPIMQAALARGDISKVDEHLDYLLNGQFGINLDRRSEAYRRLGLAVLRKNVAALEAIKRRAEGQPVETPPLASITSSTTSTTGATLTAAFEGWKRQRNRAPGTLAEYERAIKMFTELHGNLLLVQIKRSHARQFREALQEVPGRRNGKLLNASLPELAEWGHEHPDVPKITAGTVNKQLTAVQAIANWAHDNGMIPDEVQWADPFRRMRLGEDEAVRGGAPFELSDLQVIFHTPVFAEGARPTGGKGDAAFWLPLLALFTGARLNELASLRASAALALLDENPHCAWDGQVADFLVPYSSLLIVCTQINKLIEVLQRLSSYVNRLGDDPKVVRIRHNHVTALINNFRYREAAIIQRENSIMAARLGDRASNALALYGEIHVATLISPNPLAT